MLHKTGNKYKTKDGLVCILSTFQIGEDCYCLLITLADAEIPDYRGYDGNRYVDPVKVENPYNVSEEEMLKIAGEGFALYTDKITI
jgi:hypothetical protein